MLPEGALLDEDLDHRDWRLAMFAKVIEWTQAFDDVHFVPIIAHSDRNDPDGNSIYVPSLSQIMKIDEEDLPHIYLLDAQTSKSIPYPKRMDEIHDFSPEIIMTWAEYMKAYQDEEHLKEALAQMESAEKGSDHDEAEHQASLDFLKKEIKETEEKVQEYKKSYDDAVEDAPEDSKDFAEEHEDYSDLAYLHLARIGQVMMEEL